MSNYSLSHLSDSVLLRELSALAARERTTLAELLAHIGEVEARRLYVPAACPSMLDYCVRELHLSAECAYKRIHAARVARRYPCVLEALADGRLHLTAVVLLAPHLSAENASERLAAAANKSAFEIKQLLVAWSPRLEAPAVVQPIGSTVPGGQLDSNPTGDQLLDSNPIGADQAPPRIEAAPRRSGVTPVSPGRFELQATIGQSTYDTLCYVQALLGHPIPSEDLERVLDGAFKAYARQLEKRKFAATDRPRRSRRASASKRHIPAHVKRAVWKRDGCRCTFVSEAGRRCSARTRLELDHIEHGGPWGPCDGGEHATAVPGSQAVRGGTHVRDRVHGG